MTFTPMHLLLISGSTRPGSSNALALAKLHELDLDDTSTSLYAGLRDLPAFVPGDAPAPAPVRDLFEHIDRADAVVFSTPEYAGGLPGSLKNLLDHTVGVGALYGKPVAWLDVANPGRGEGARTQLRIVLNYVGARIIDAACIHLTLESTVAVQPITPTEQQQLRTAHAAIAAVVREDGDLRAS